MAAQGWKVKKVYKDVVMSSWQLQPPTKKLRILAFDALAGLADLKVVILNEEWLERPTAVSFP
jgi:hypothetical protein